MIKLCHFISNTVASGLVIFRNRDMSMAICEGEKKTHTFTWRIKNYSLCSKKRGEVLNSPTFRAKSFDDSAWKLWLYPLGDYKSKQGYTSCYLTRIKDDAVSSDIECDYSIEIIDKDGHTVKRNKCTRKFGKGGKGGWSNYINTDELMKYALYDDVLVIRCKLCGNMPKKNSHNMSTTKFKNSNHSFQWTVKDFESSNSQEVINFPSLGSSQIEMNLRVPEDEVKIAILISGNLSRSQFMSCTIVLLDVEGKERDSRQDTHLFKNNADTWEFPTFMKKSEIIANKDVYLKGGCVTLQCDIAVSDGSFIESIEETDLSDDEFTNSDVDTLAVLNEDIKRMYTDKIHTDIKLKVGDEVFSAHKSILCARSVVFLAMFDNDMAESQKGEVDILDLDAKTVDLLLEYIYTGTVNDLDYENAIKLILAADKYQVLLLKNKCAELLKSLVSDANVCEILVAADLVRHDTLKASIFDYIRQQPKKIFKSEEWKLLLKANLMLATETVSEVAILLGDQAMNSKHE